MAARPKAAGGVWASLKGYLEHHRDSVKWLLGISTATGCAVVVGQQVLDPHSVAHRASASLKARVQDAGMAASSWAKSAIQRAASPQQRVLGPTGHQQAAAPPGSIQGYAARWLADWCAQPERSHLAVALGGGPLLDWLIETATAIDQQDEGATAADIAEQQQAERALTFLLQQDATAALLVERPGAVPRLLRHCFNTLQLGEADSLLAEPAHKQAPPGQGAGGHAAVREGLIQLYRALQRRAFAGLVVSADAGAATHATDAWPEEQAEPEPELSVARMVHKILGGPAGGGSAGGAWARGEVYLSDLQDVMEMLLHGDVAAHPNDGLPLTAAAPEQLVPAGATATQQQQQVARGVASATEPVQSTARTVGEISEGEQLRPWQLEVQAMAAAWLASWAEAHASNSDKLTELNVSAAIAQVAGKVSGRPACDDSRSLQLQLVRLISALATPGSSSEALLYRTSQSIFSSADTSYPASRMPQHVANLPAPHHLAACLQPLLFITADAAVEHDGARAAAALHALTRVLMHGGQPVAEMAATEPVMPLLDKLVAETKELNVQQAAVDVVAAMAHNPTSLGDASRSSLHVSRWRDWLLAKLCQDSQEPGHEQLKAACSAALAELAALPGLPGLQVTHYWLAALLATLATRVWPYNAVGYTGPQDGVMGPPLPPPPSTSQPTGLKRYFTRHRKDKPAPAVAATGSTGTAATGSNGTAATAGSNGTAAAVAGSNGTAATAVDGSAGGNGAAVDARDLVDAVPVLPSHIAAVASALEAASAAVSEEHEPPPDFDPGAAGAAAPLARAFYKQAAHAVDMMVAEQRVCQALEVLNALVAADPSKQRWLLSVGILPLLHRLIHPPADIGVDTSAVLQHLSNIPEPTKGLPIEAALAAKQAASEALPLPAGTGGQPAPAQPARAPGLATRLYNSLPSMPWRRTSGDAAGAGSAKSSSTQQQVISGAAGQAALAKAGAAQQQQQQQHPELQDVHTDHDGPSLLCLKRQVARLLALLVIQPGARHAVSSTHWQPWLQHAAQDADCRLASHATKALLNLEAFRQRDSETARWHRSQLQDLSWSRRITGFTTSGHHPGMPLPLNPPTGINISTAARSLAAPAPVYQDMVHLLDPSAQHLWTLAESGTRPHSSQLLEQQLQPSTDVVLQAAAVDAAIADMGDVAPAGGAMQNTHFQNEQQLPASGKDKPAIAVCSGSSMAEQQQASELHGPSNSAVAPQHHGSLLEAAGLQAAQSIDRFQQRLLTAASCVADMGAALLPAVATMQGGVVTSSFAAAATAGSTTHPSSSDHTAALVPEQHPISHLNTDASSEALHTTLPNPAANSPRVSASSPGLSAVSGDSAAGQDSTSARSTVDSNATGSVWKRFSWWTGRPAPPSAEVAGALLGPSTPQADARANAHAATAQPGNRIQTPLVGRPMPESLDADAKEAGQSVAASQQHSAQPVGGGNAAEGSPKDGQQPGPGTEQFTYDSPQQLTTGTERLEDSSQQQLTTGTDQMADRLPFGQQQQLAAGSGPNVEALTDPRVNDAAAAPFVDVVFVHGIRGGPFITWRKPGSTAKSKAGRGPSAYLTRSHCWPSDWLPQDVPCARLLTVEYLAPVSGWEGESLPLEATVERVMSQLEAAGVGQRPVVFVAHSMGGLLIKEVLARSLRCERERAEQAAASPRMVKATVPPSLASATRGIVFFATPHFGSELAAMGWKLRHMPYASPAPALARLTPGPHLVELNDALQQLHASGSVQVVSVVEGQPTQLAPVLPKLHVVPQASAYPGFGKLVVLPNDDHISLCKPPSKQAESYQVVLGMIQNVLAQELGTGTGDLLHPSQP